MASICWGHVKEGLILSFLRGSSQHDYFTFTLLHAPVLHCWWLTPFQPAAAFWTFWQKCWALQSSHCHCFLWALLPVLGLMNECLHLFLLLPRLTQKSFHMLYMEGLGLASWPPGSLPCSLALLQNQLIFSWQRTLTCILVNPSHSQEMESAEIILVTAKGIHRADRSKVTVGC